MVRFLLKLAREKVSNCGSFFIEKGGDFSSKMMVRFLLKLAREKVSD
jgi:hypothetical protein